MRPGLRRDDIVIGDVEAARSGGPAETGIEHQKRHQAEPEDRGGIADKADNAHDLIGRAALANSRQNTHGNTQNGAEQGADRGQFKGCREHPADILEHRVGGEHRGAEVAAERAGEVDPELHVERLVEAEFEIDLVVGRGRGAVADPCQHRVDGHHPVDDEGDGEEPQEGQRHGGSEASESQRKGPEGAEAPSDRQRRRSAHEGRVTLWSRPKRCCCRTRAR